jgi:hypothetical protein
MPCILIKNIILIRNFALVSVLKVTNLYLTISLRRDLHKSLTTYNIRDPISGFKIIVQNFKT